MTVFEIYFNILGVEIRFRIVVPEWFKKHKQTIGFINGTDSKKKV